MTLTTTTPTTPVLDAGPAPAPDGAPEPDHHARVLDVVDLRTTFRTGGTEVTAVRGVSFSLARREALVLLGESGSGKSVTARSLLRLYGPSTRIEGRALLDGEDLLAVDPRRMRSIRNTALSLVPQDPVGALNPLRRVGTQLVEVLRQHGVEANRKAAWRRAEELLRLVGIADPRRVARAYPSQLSGGMCQRAVIAIAVSCDPAVLVADEPTTALDVTVQAQILELFHRLQVELGMALLLVTHDVGVAEQMADRVAVMYAGRIVEQGPAERVLSSPGHPYTAALLASLPTPGTPRGELYSIPGQPVVAGELGAGCPFAPRCSRAVAACLDAEPDLVPIAVGHERACIDPAVPVAGPVAVGAAP